MLLNERWLACAGQSVDVCLDEGTCSPVTVGGILLLVNLEGGAGLEPFRRAVRLVRRSCR